MSNQHISTKALHAGHDTTQTLGTRAVPIYQSASYVFNDTDHAANLFSLAELGFIYTRLNNPTNDILQNRLAAIEGGIGATAPFDSNQIQDGQRPKVEGWCLRPRISESRI